MQKTLFDMPPARAGQVTQQAAAQSIRHRTPAMRQRVLQYIAESPVGATIDEIAIALEMRTSTVCGRVNELANMEKIAWDGKTQRRTSSGCIAKVWTCI